MVAVGVAAAVIGAMAALRGGPYPLTEFRKQLAGIAVDDVVYIESRQTDGTPGFSADRGTVKTCYDAVLHAESKSKAGHKMGTPIFFYLRPDDTGLQRRRPVWVSTREMVAEEFGEGMKACFDSFDKTAKPQAPK